MTGKNGRKKKKNDNRYEIRTLDGNKEKTKILVF